MTKAVIFDFDGVIINSEPIHYQIEKELFAENGLHIDINEYMNYAGLSEKETYQELNKKYNINLNGEALLNEKIRRFKSYVENADSLPVSPGVDSLIKALHASGIRLAIGTSGTREICESVLTKLSLIQFFPVIVSGADVITLPGNLP